MRDQSERISVIIPAYNEADHIYRCLEETVKTLAGWDWEVIVVDDGSQDSTADEVRRAMALGRNVKLMEYSQNTGKGHALRHGFGGASGELVAFLDADLDLHPRQILTLVDVLKKERADVVIGSKRHPQSQLSYPFYRRIISDAYYLIVRLLFGLPVRDTQTGIKVFRREMLEQVLPKLAVKRFAFDLELLVVAHLLKYAIREAPIQLDFQRRFGRIHFSDVRNIWLDTMAVFYRRYLLRYYG